MAGNVVIIQHALNAGEVSRRTEGRQDQNKYLASLEVCENFIPLTLGGITRRPGTMFVAKTKYSGLENDTVRLIDFQFSNEQAYILEFGDEYIRFYADGAQIQTMEAASVMSAEGSSTASFVSGVGVFAMTGSTTATFVGEAG